MAGLADYVWHTDESMMFLWFKKVIGGGAGGDDTALILGCSIDNDYTGATNYSQLWNLMADDSYLKTQLYMLYMTDDWIDYDWDDDNMITNRFSNGAIVQGIPNHYLNVSWPVGGDLITVATRGRRFLPRNDTTIYVYLQSSLQAENQAWTLPKSWVNATLSADMITPNGIVRDIPITVGGRTIKLFMEPGFPVRITRKK